MVSEEIRPLEGYERTRLKEQCQQSIAGLSDFGGVDPEMVLRLIHELDQAKEILDPLSQLLSERGFRVLLNAEDPRLVRQSSVKMKNVSRIVVNTDRTKWKDVVVTGESMAHALSVAAKKYGTPPDGSL